MNGRVFVVFNPKSGKGRGASLVRPVLSALERLGVGGVEHALTGGAGEEERLAAVAARGGATTIVAVGGDGTWCNAANGILKSGVEACLALVSGGTGCDLAKTLGVPADVAGAARVVAQGVPRRIDVGRVEDRYFLNVAGFGYDIAVIEHSWKVRWLRGDLLYAWSALRQIWGFPGFGVEVGIDGAASARHELLMLIVANARIFGGTFRIAPRAVVDDGRLDAFAFANMGLVRRLGMMKHLLAGTHQGAAGVASHLAASLRLRFDAPPAYETDGEWRQARDAELTVEAVPKALSVLVPAAAGVP
jgi:diacylglycerol kinase (ATP)